MNPSRIATALALSLLISTSITWSANVASPPVALSLKEQAKTKQVKADMESISVALAMYKLNAGTYPTAEQGLKCLVEKPVAAPVPRRWAMLFDKIPQDPWGRDYRYVVREKDGEISHVIISDGPDLSDSADDIEHPLEAEKK